MNGSDYIPYITRKQDVVKSFLLYTIAYTAVLVLHFLQLFVEGKLYQDAHCFPAYPEQLFADIESRFQMSFLQFYSFRGNFIPAL